MNSQLLDSIQAELEIQRRLLEKVKKRREELQNEVLRTGDRRAAEGLQKINRVLKKITS